MQFAQESKYTWILQNTEMKIEIQFAINIFTHCLMSQGEGIFRCEKPEHSTKKKLKLFSEF